jgi:ligand-binding sensor domain-containing protein/signal transduction histidine kinase
MSLLIISWLRGFDKIKITFSLIVLILLNAILYGSNDLAHVRNLRFHKISNPGSLANNRINNIIKDSKGYMWFATENGVARYDGNEVKNYFFDQKEPSSLYGNFVISFLIDNEQQLWIGTDLGLMIYNPTCDNFRRIPVDIPSEKRQNILDLKILPDNTILVLTSKRVLYYNRKTNSLKLFFSIDEINDVENNEEFYQFIVNTSSTKQLLIFTQHNIVNATFPVKKFELLRHPCGIVRKLYQQDKTHIWISAQNGLFVFEPYEKKIVQFLPKDKAYKKYFLHEIRDFLIDKNGNYWIATDQDGIFYYNTETAGCVHFYHKEFDNQSLNNNLIRKIYIDNLGILWVGTQYEGINYAILNNPKEFILYQKQYDKSNSLSSNIISAILKDNNGNLWIGTDGGGLNIISKVSGNITHYSAENKSSGLSTNAVLALYQDSRNNIWIGGYNGFISLYNPVTRSWHQFKNICDQPGCNGLHDVRQFMEDSKHRIWIATNGHGLIMFEYKTGTFKFFNELKNNIVNNYVLSLCEADDGRIWAGTYDGLYLIDPEKLSSVFFNYSEYSKSGLSNNWIYCIHRDHKNRMWFGTAFGLNQYDKKSNIFLKYYTSDGLPGNVIDGILEDENGILWISTNYGISKFNPDLMTFNNYYLEDGLPGNEFIHGSFYKSKEGELFFGSNFGLVSFYPSRIRRDSVISPVVIKDIQVFFKSIINQGYCDTTFKQPAIQKIRLSYKQSTITFIYTALNYINTRNNNFSYRLEGYEQKWNNVGNRREATYINIKPGRYTFHVKGCNNEGVCDDTGDRVMIIIRPPWWGTWFFRLVVALVLIVSLVAAYYWRVTSIMKQKAKLEELVQKRTAELREKNRELNELNKMNERIFSIIAHDLKSPFNAVMGFTEILEKKAKNDDNEENRKRYISYIKGAINKIFALMENLLLWSSSHLKGATINRVKYSLNEQINSNIELITEVTGDKAITIKFNPRENYFVIADYNMIDAVIRNLLSNAFKFSTSNDVITIELARKANEVICSITDQGVGISADEINILFSLDSRKIKTGTNGEQGSGLGLVLCHDFVTLNGGKIWVKSRPGKGSTFSFSIPASND